MTLIDRLRSGLSRHRRPTPAGTTYVRCQDCGTRFCVEDDDQAIPLHFYPYLTTDAANWLAVPCPRGPRER